MDDQITPERQSALAGHYAVGKSGVSGADDSPGVILEDMKNLELHQVAAWADSIDETGRQAAAAVGAASAPGPCRSEFGTDGSILRVEPLKWWLYAAAAPELDAEQGATLDISHSRTHIRITGPEAAEFLNRFLPLDLRESAFPEGAVASSVIHHVGVTLWRSRQGYEIFIPRGFALSLWQGMVQVARQFGLEVR